MGYKHSQAKQYFKDVRALRIETVMIDRWEVENAGLWLAHVADWLSHLDRRERARPLPVEHPDRTDMPVGRPGRRHPDRRYGRHRPRGPLALLHTAEAGHRSRPQN